VLGAEVWAVFRRFAADPSSSVFGVAGEPASGVEAAAAAAAAAPRCINFIAIRREDIFFGVNIGFAAGGSAGVGAMVGGGGIDARHGTVPELAVR